jgi:hypothetical protein
MLCGLVRAEPQMTTYLPDAFIRLVCNPNRTMVVTDLSTTFGYMTGQ